MSTNHLLPTVTATLSLTLSASVSADIATHWLSQRVGTPGSLALSISDTDTVLSLTAFKATFGFSSISVGNTILVDEEAMSVLSIEGEQITVARNVAPLSPPAQPHNAGASIVLLKYPDPWAVIAAEALLPWAQQVVTSLGSSSATFGSKITGSLSLNMGAA